MMTVTLIIRSACVFILSEKSFLEEEFVYPSWESVESASLTGGRSWKIIMFGVHPSLDSEGLTKM